MALAAAVIGKNTAAKNAAVKLFQNYIQFKRDFLHKIALQKSGDMLL